MSAYILKTFISKYTFPCTLFHRSNF